MNREAIKAAMTACIGITGVLTFWAVLIYSFGGGK